MALKCLNSYSSSLLGEMEGKTDFHLQTSPSRFESCVVKVAGKGELEYCWSDCKLAQIEGQFKWIRSSHKNTYLLTLESHL